MVRTSLLVLSFLIAMPSVFAAEKLTVQTYGIGQPKVDHGIVESMSVLVNNYGNDPVYNAVSYTLVLKSRVPQTAPIFTTRVNFQSLADVNAFVAMVKARATMLTISCWAAETAIGFDYRALSCEYSL